MFHTLGGVADFRMQEIGSYLSCKGGLVKTKKTNKKALSNLVRWTNRSSGKAVSINNLYVFRTSLGRSMRIRPRPKIGNSALASAGDSGSHGGAPEEA